MFSSEGIGCELKEPQIALIVGLILAGLILDLGGVPGEERLGFRYWRSPYEVRWGFPGFPLKLTRVH